MSGESSLIQLEEVCKYYHMGTVNEVHALERVSLTVEPGEFVAIVGQSGSGKSTLMNCIGCLDHPTSGTYRFRGRDVQNQKDSMLSRIRNREIGFVFQGFNLIQSLDALENVELPLVYRGVPRPERILRAEEALELVGLQNRMCHRPSQLSGGQQQRVAIARAIAAEPSLLLADEPTGNLDTQSGAEIVQLLRRLHQSGRTVILITHDDHVAHFAERILEIRDGRLVSDRASSCVG